MVRKIITDDAASQILLEYVRSNLDKIRIENQSGNLDDITLDHLTELYLKEYNLSPHHEYLLDLTPLNLFLIKQSVYDYYTQQFYDTNIAPLIHQ